MMIVPLLILKYLLQNVKKKKSVWTAAWLEKMQNFLFAYTVAFALGYISGKCFENQNDRKYALTYNIAYIVFKTLWKFGGFFFN